MIKNSALILFLFFSFEFCASQKPETADQVIAKIWNAVGGTEAWEKSRYFRFDFEVEVKGKVVSSRRHLWDRYTGDYRLERKLPDGSNLLALFNVNSQTGQCYVNGEIETADSVNSKYLKTAYATFIKDSYWLINPVKLQDPGVKLVLMPDEKIGKTNCNVLALTFKDHVRLTPQDQYWLYADKKTGEIIKWKYKLEGSASEESDFNWSAYKDIGGIKFSDYKKSSDGNTVIHFPVVQVLKEVDENLFNNPLVTMK